MTRSLIFTCAGGIYLEKLVAILKKHNPDKKIYGLDANTKLNNDQNLFTQVFNIPTPDKKNYFTELLKNIKTIGPSILIPGADEEAFLLSEYSQELESRNILCNVMNKKEISIIRDKFLFNSKINKEYSNYSVECFEVKNFSELKSICYDLGYPANKVIFKPKIGRGRRDTFIISSKNVKSKYSDSIPYIPLKEFENNNIFNKNSMIAMEFIDGKSITIDVLADRGTLIQCVVREWNENWRFPFPGQKIICNSKVLDLVNYVSTNYNLHGLIDIDAIMTSEGRIVLLEVNPRPSGSIVVTEKAGFPILNMLENVLEGRPINKFNINKQIEINNL